MKSSKEKIVNFGEIYLFLCKFFLILQVLLRFIRENFCGVSVQQKTGSRAEIYCDGFLK